MKVIFLDFDGVLNSQGSFLYEDNRRKKHKEQGVKGPVQETLCNVCTANFQFVLDQYKDVKIVLSTTWRNLYSIDWLKAKLESYHIDSSRVIDKTPEHRMTGDRGQEISHWLDQHPEVTHYIVIDDNDWGISPLHGDRFVKTTWEGGFTTAHAAEACEKLSKHHLKKIKAALKAEDSGEEPS
jgi:hypothetical protein